MRMSTLVTIGDFARMTYLSIKSLRYYHEVGLLAPASVDPDTGYRLYLPEQVPTAQVIRRLRDLDMPRRCRAVLTAGDVAARNAIIASHLRRMERQLQQTQAAVSSLRVLLEGGQAPIQVEYRSTRPQLAIAVRAEFAASDLGDWWADAFDELRAALAGGDVRRAGPDGALYHSEFFTEALGETVAFIPITGSLARGGGAAARTARDRIRGHPAPGPIRRTGQDLRRARHLRQRAGDRRGRPDPGELPRHRR